MTSCFVYKVTGLTFHEINSQLIYLFELAQVVARRITKPQRFFRVRISLAALFLYSFLFLFIFGGGGGVDFINISMSYFFSFYLFFYFIFYPFNMYKTHI